MNAPQHTLPLPQEGLALSAKAGPLLGAGGWRALMEATAAVLQTLDTECVAWFCPLATSDDDEQEHLVGLLLAPAPEDADVSSIPMEVVGVQPLPEMAFPALISFQHQVHRVWLDDEEGPVCLYLHQDDPAAAVENLAVQSLEELSEVETARLPSLRLDFDMQDLEPTVTLGGARPEDLDAAEKHLERLKIAFIWQFAYMVINADNKLDPRELRFIQQRFPTPLLDKVGLVDERGEFLEPDFTLAKTEALKVLPTALSLEDRINMLRTLQQAAWADGVLLPEEARVFRLARQLLEVPREALN